MCERGHPRTSTPRIHARGKVAARWRTRDRRAHRRPPRAFRIGSRHAALRHGHRFSVHASVADADVPRTTGDDPSLAPISRTTQTGIVAESSEARRRVRRARPWVRRHCVGTRSMRVDRRTSWGRAIDAREQLTAPSSHDARSRRGNCRVRLTKTSGHRRDARALRSELLSRARNALMSTKTLSTPRDDRPRRGRPHFANRRRGATCDDHTWATVPCRPKRARPVTPSP